MDQSDTDAKQLGAEHFRVTAEEFMRFLNGVGMNTTCSECGADSKWSVDFGNGTDEPDDADYLTVYRMNFAKSSLLRVFFAMNCDVCGSHRTIYASKLMEWLETNPEAAE